MAAGSAGPETPVTPPLNILKIWACDELLCKSYEKNVPPFPLTQYIVRRVGPIINEFCQFYTAGFTYMLVVQVKMTHLNYYNKKIIENVAKHIHTFSISNVGLQ